MTKDVGFTTKYQENPTVEGDFEENTPWSCGVAPPALEDASDRQLLTGAADPADTVGL